MISFNEDFLVEINELKWDLKGLSWNYNNEEKSEESERPQLSVVQPPTIRLFLNPPVVTLDC